MEPIAALARNSQALRRTAELLADNLQQLARWREVTVATAQVNRWISADIRSRALAAREQAQRLRKAAAVLQTEAIEQRQRSLRAAALAMDTRRK